MRGTVILVLLVLGLLSMLPTTSAETINRISITIDYDPVIDIAVVEYTITLDQQLTKETVIDVPLIVSETVEIINVTGDAGQAFLYDYNADTHTLTVFANETTSITVYYTTTGLLEEVAPYTFNGLIDLSTFETTNLVLVLSITGKYEVEVEPSEGVSVDFDGESTIITMTAPNVYTIFIYAEVGELTTTTTQTITTTPASTTTTTTSGEVGEETSYVAAPTGTEKETSPLPVSNMTLVLILLMVVALIAGAIVLVKGRK